MSRAYRPTQLSEAVAILADRQLNATPVAGCTDLMVVDHAQRRQRDAVVSLLKVRELLGISEEDDCLDIGAAVSFWQLRKHPSVRAMFPILEQVSATVGAWQIQNRATIGGNIANASPAGDSLPVLLVLGAELVLAGPQGERRLPYSAFHRGYRQTALRPGELIVRVRLPFPRANAVGAFKKVGTREAQAISKVVVAFHATRLQGRLYSVRLAAGSVAAVPLRLLGAEQVCEGEVPDAELAERVGLTAASEVEPIDDVRSTASYRRRTLGRVVRRMLLDTIGTD